MEIINPRCGGLDLHKGSMTCCAKVLGKKKLFTFNTYTEGIRALGNWLTEQQVTTLAMESTGVYWKPIWNILETEFSNIKLVLAHAQHVKQLPGRKTDVSDAEWLADLHSCGLIKGSRVPSRDERENSEILRARRRLIEQRSRVVVRIQKLAEGANLKLSNVVSSITGKAGMAVLKAVASGETDARKLQELTNTGLKAKPEEILAALENSVGVHQRVILQVYLEQIEILNKGIKTLDQEIGKRMLPFEESAQLIDTVPGFTLTNGQEVLGYAGGPAFDDFPSAKHFASWTGLCPGNSVSAGKSKSRKAKQGNPWLKGVFIEAAWGAIRTKGSYDKGTCISERRLREVLKKPSLPSLTHS